MSKVTTVTVESDDETPKKVIFTFNHQEDNSIVVNIDFQPEVKTYDNEAYLNIAGLILNTLKD